MSEPTLIKEPAQPWVIVDTAVAMNAAVEGLSAGTGPLGVDAERASGYRYGQRAFLVQIRREGAGTYLFDPTRLATFRPLADVVNSLEWILHAADQDLPGLNDLGLRPGALWDTELAARLLGSSRPGLATVLADSLGVSLAKEHSAVDWSKRPLPEDWLTYAALDVEYLADLRERQIVALAHAGKLSWALAEFEHLRQAPPPDEDPERWRRLPGLSAVKSRRGLAIAQQLWHEREDRAQARDLPPTRVLHNNAVVAAAVAEPADTDELSRLAEFSTRGVKPQVSSWWQVIKRARALSEHELPPLHAARGPGELPKPRVWRQSNPEAFERLTAVRDAVQSVGDDLDIPHDKLLPTQVQRHVAWDPDANQKLADVMTQHGARDWQVEQTLDEIARALSAANDELPNAADNDHRDNNSTTA